MSKTCSFERCERKHYGKGLCEGHYQQQWRGEELRPLRKQISKAELERLRAQGLKKCFDCGQVKPFEEFGKNKRTKDGRNPQCKACRAEYYQANRERRQEYNRRWVRENLDKARANNALRRARKRQATTEEFTPEDLVRIWGPNPDCMYCRERPAEHWDHFVPLSKGGRHSVYNLFPACAECNLSKNAKHPYEWLYSLMTEEEQAAFIAALEARMDD